MTIDAVHDPASFASYILSLRREFDNPDAKEKWENTDLSSYFEAMAAWAVDWKGSVQANPWRHAAELIRAATIYE
ncbi:DUF7660 family protein [Sphingobium sp. CAP-1]|uniref:DUF7660 family protein n=1 Tax=Sphingobium sp. CAP-1 TaxID=2676077 RepID=UPI0012BB28A1|nr:hypothetical protein [Sphingobium sp. CAP-1]QGP78376.1 hypothetical protein GL174_04770 [Sphingobium sp. CAP-1]